LIWIALAPLLSLLNRRQPLYATALTAVSVLTADLLALVIKLAVGRPRPFETIPEADKLMNAAKGLSMPSAHAATAFAGAVAFAYLFRRYAALAFLLAAAIAYSRIYVGVHYPSDVLAGAALGMAVAGALLFAVRSLRPTSAGPPRSGAGPPAG
jgi:undecaprenyl-diphosphatase